jgi:hypothetical protein
MKIVPTLKLKLLATINSKIVQRRPRKGYWQDILELIDCTKRREGNGVSIVQERSKARSQTIYACKKKKQKYGEMY